MGERDITYIFYKYIEDINTRGIPLYKINDVINDIDIHYNNLMLENQKLKNQIEMKNALLETYETIIGNSNFKPILNKTKKE